MRVIAGLARGALLSTRKGEGTRPTSDKVKGALFNVLGPVFEGTSFLDLFAGSGAIGIEALSRGAAMSVFVEKERTAAEHIRKNLHKTGFVPKSRVLALDVLQALRILQQEGLSFEHIFLDPPYGDSMIGPVLAAIREKHLLKRRGIIIVEHARDSSNWLDGTFDVLKERSYGDTVVTFLSGKENEEGEMFL